MHPHEHSWDEGEFDVLIERPFRHHGPGRGLKRWVERHHGRFAMPRRPFGPGHPGGPFGRPGGPDGPFGDDPFDEEPRPRRHRRGDIKFALLEVLADQPRHGYEVIKELEQRYGGFYRPSPGSVYPTLQLLEDEGHLVSETVDGKRVYTVTESGKQLLEEWRAQRDQGSDRRGFRGPQTRPELHQLREQAMSLMASVMAVGRHGTPEQLQAVLALLDTTRREIYRILAEGGSGSDNQDITKL